MDGLKIFAVNDCDWYAAETLYEAVTAAVVDYGGPEDEVIEDPVELTNDEMNTLIYTGEKMTDTGVEPMSHLDDTENPRMRWKSYKCSFREELNRMIEEGKEFPCMFASTEY